MSQHSSQLKAQYWAREFKKEWNINIFDDTRKREVVTARALHVYCCRKILKWTLYQIKDFYNTNGKKSYDHATVLHALRMFDIYCKYDPHLLEMFGKIAKRYTSPEDKLTQLASKLYFINPVFYADIEGCLTNSYEKTIAWNESRLKEDKGRKKIEKTYAV